MTALSAAADDTDLIVIDPGHGGRDPGAIGARGTQEKRIALAAALDLKRRLEAGGRCRVTWSPPVPPWSSVSPSAWSRR